MDLNLDLLHPFMRVRFLAHLDRLQLLAQVVKHLKFSEFVRCVRVGDGCDRYEHRCRAACANLTEHRKRRDASAVVWQVRRGERSGGQCSWD